MATTQKKVQYWLATDYRHYNGGVYNLQVCRVMQVGMSGGYVKIFTSVIDKAEKRARAWAKKNGLDLVS